MEYFILYLFAKLSVLHGIAHMAVMFGFLVGGFTILNAAMDGKPFPHGSKPLQWSKWALVAGLLFAALVPTQKDVGIIVGGKMAIDIAKSEEVSTISKKIFAVVNKKLDEASK